MESERDRLSDLPDFLLLHILKFMNAKHAVQTCVLSTRWKDLWKILNSLVLDSSAFTSLPHFNKFVFWVLTQRDGSISLHNLKLRRNGCTESELVDRVMTYAVSHNVLQLTMEVNLNFENGFKLHPSIFYCRSLTHLKLSIWAIPWMTELPTSLQLPALTSLHLEHITFAANDSGFAEPFSNCRMLNTLVLDRCNLHRNAKFLCISNSKLSFLSIGSTIQEATYKVVLSTPNLSSLTITRDLIHQVSSCDLSLLKQVNIDVQTYFHSNFEMIYMALISWLQVLANHVKIMTLSSSTINILNVVLSTSGSLSSQLPCFVRLKSLKLKKGSSLRISEKQLSRIVDCLVKNSPQTKVDIIDIIDYAFLNDKHAKLYRSWSKKRTAAEEKNR